MENNKNQWNYVLYLRNYDKLFVIKNRYKLMNNSIKVLEKKTLKENSMKIYQILIEFMKLLKDSIVLTLLNLIRYRYFLNLMVCNSK